MLSDTGITAGHLTGADICFLIAIILGVIGAVVAYSAKALWATAVAAAVAFIAFGLFLL